METAEIPKAYRGIVARAPQSRVAAVKAMCLQCVGYERNEARDCSDRACPLWHWRPYRPKDEGAHEATPGPR